MSGKTRKIPMEGLDKFRQQIEGRMDMPMVSNSESIEMPIGLLDAAPWNARRYFDPKSLDDLAQDMKSNGMIHAVLVRPVGSGRYEVVVGERRFRAAQSLSWHKIRANIRHLSDNEARRIGLAENLEREDLNPYEETIGWLDLLELNFCDISEFSTFQTGKINTRAATISILRRYKHEMEKLRHNVMPKQKNIDFLVIGSPLEAAILETFSKEKMSWKSFLENRLPILQFPNDLTELLQSGKLDYTKAKIVNKIQNQQLRQNLLEEIIRLNLPLTQVRERVAALLTSERPKEVVLDKQLFQRFTRIASSLQKKKFDEPKRNKIALALQQFEELIKSN